MKVDNNDKNNKEISLKIKYEDAFKIIRINQSTLNDYNTIFNRIANFICSKENLDLKDLKTIEICLSHPEKETIKINNKEEWNLFYDCGIINEYVIDDIKKNKLFLNVEYNIINNKENIDDINNLENLENEIKNIMENIPNYFFL